MISSTELFLIFLFIQNCFMIQASIIALVLLGSYIIAYVTTLQLLHYCTRLLQDFLTLLLFCKHLLLLLSAIAFYHGYLLSVTCSSYRTSTFLYFFYLPRTFILSGISSRTFFITCLFYLSGILISISWWACCIVSLLLGNLMVLISLMNSSRIFEGVWLSSEVIRI